MIFVIHKNIIKFGVDNSCSVDPDNRKKDVLILGEGPTDGLYETAITPEAEYSISFSEQQKKFCLSLHYNGSNSFLFVNRVKIYQFKARLQNRFMSIMFS